MDRLNRNERISVLQRILCESPGKIFTLGFFTDMFNCAKSSVSEDIDIIRISLEKTGAGTIETIPGASGGVRYVPMMPESEVLSLAEKLSAELSRKERILPGGYLYMLDAIYDPGTVSEVSRVFACYFHSRNIDYVITVETKGIPLAFMTAAYLSRPLLIARRNIEATDGASVNINYVSGSSDRIQTMVLPMRSLKRGSQLLFIDDFMKGGGTTKGILELAREFDCRVAGAGVLIETALPGRKLPVDYFSLLTLHGIDEAAGIADIRPSSRLFREPEAKKGQ
jgi:purine operon repressor